MLLFLLLILHFICVSLNSFFTESPMFQSHDGRQFTLTHIKSMRPQRGSENEMGQETQEMETYRILIKSCLSKGKILLNIG